MHMVGIFPEIDALMKGMRAGGGDKSDIFRIMWDNGVYGQSFRGQGSFRGKTNLYCNILATGTPAQFAKLFADIENGLVTRCSFTDLGNQEFAAYQPWKKLSKRDLQIIQNFALWFADVEVMKSLKWGGAKYNEFVAKQTESKASRFSNIFDQLPEQFTKGDLKIVLAKSANACPIRTVVYTWRSRGLITKVDKNTWKKA